jgi:phosphate transport system permease protein
MVQPDPTAPAGDHLFRPPANLERRKFADRSFVFWGFGATAIGLIVLGALVFDLWVDGAGRLDVSFFTNFPSDTAERSGLLSALVGSLMLIITTALIGIPMGVLAAIYLEEYAPRNALTAALEITVNNLAGVPSIVYGLLGLGLFLTAIGGGAPTVLVGGLTLALLILPIIIVATREAVRSVPGPIREAALAVGATRWQTTSHHVLPYATPGIITGIIIGLSRALGETAPLIVLSVPTFVQFIPLILPNEIGEPMYAADGVRDTNVFDMVASWLPSSWLNQEFTALPLLMYSWTEEPSQAFRENAAAAGIVLLLVTLLLNAVAIWVRYQSRRNIRW